MGLFNNIENAIFRSAAEIAFGDAQSQRELDGKHAELKKMEKENPSGLKGIVGQAVQGATSTVHDRQRRTLDDTVRRIEQNQRQQQINDSEYY